MKLGIAVNKQFQEVLFDKLSVASLPLKTIWKLKGIAKIVREQSSTYEDVRVEALKKHGLKNEDGSLKTDEKGNALFDAAGMEGFAKEMQDLVDIEITTPTIKLSELGDNLNLNLAEIELLDGVVVED